mmetsp:Transcript_2856/g.4252  ORF Transcript_2856/g.4252 Transcript_2856/m.4252 type:complete len:540 (+) Transcript_2856:68-1687(+)
MTVASSPSCKSSAFQNGTDPLLDRLRTEANEIVCGDPHLLPLLENSILSPEIESFEDAIAIIMAHRLTTFCPPAFPIDKSTTGGSPSPFLLGLLQDALASSETEAGHDMSYAIRADAEAIVDRDPACESLLEAVLFFKGFAALVCHRAARRKWPYKDTENNYHAVPSSFIKKKGVTAVQTKSDRFAALFLQSQAAAAFGVDIHPAASIGAGVVIDHATGVVIGETATIGDGCTILHGVTLGGTAKDGSWDRHPKIGCDVLIGAGTSILGNIKIGDGAKIGSGSVVLRPIPSGATAVGAPAKIIGFAKEAKPGSKIDLTLSSVEPLIQKDSDSSTGSLTSETEAMTEDDNDNDNPSDTAESRQKQFNKEKGSDGLMTAAEDTESMPPGCREWVVPKSNDSCNFCPFRALTNKKPTSLPPGALNQQTVSQILLQEGCTEDEIGEVFFALLKCTSPKSKERRSFCISPCTFRRNFPEIASKFTSISLRRIDAITKGDAKSLKLCRRAKIAFKKTFKELRNVDINRALGTKTIPSILSTTPQT